LNKNKFYQVFKNSEKMPDRMPYTENAIRMAFFFWLFGIRMAFLHVYGIFMCMTFCLAFCASEVCRNEFCFGGILLNAVDQFWHFSSISFVFLTLFIFPEILFLQKNLRNPHWNL